MVSISPSPTTTVSYSNRALSGIVKPPPSSMPEMMRTPPWAQWTPTSVSCTSSRACAGVALGPVMTSHAAGLPPRSNTSQCEEAPPGKSRRARQW